MDNLRRFLLVFIAIIFVTLSVCGLVLASSYNNTAKTEDKDLSVSAPTYDPQAPNDSGKMKENILFIVGDKDGGETELMLLANVDTENAAISFLYIPKDIQFSISGERYIGNMGRLLAKTGSASASANIVSAFMDLGIKYYVQMPCDVFADFINAFDKESAGIDYHIGVDMKYVSGKYNIDLKKDTNKLGGREAMQLIQFYRTENNEYTPELLAFYDGSDVKRIEAAQRFLKAFISQKFISTSGNDQYKQNFASIAEPFIKRCDTNIEVDDLKIIGTVFTSLSDDRVKYYRINGTEQFLNQYYLIYNQMCTDLSSNSVQEASFVLRDHFKTN